MGEVLKVFISATSDDLGAVRTAAKHALLTLGYFPVEQEHFGPAPETILEMLHRRVEESDAVLHIVGECYGSEPPVAATDGPEPGAGGTSAELGGRRAVVAGAGAGGARRSFAQWEYHYARELRKPLYVFVCGNDFPYAPHDDESSEVREFQRVHRAAVLAGSHKYEPIPDLAALDSRLREVDLRTQRFESDLRRTRRRGLLIGGALAAAFAILAAIIVWNVRRNPDLLRQTADAAVQKAFAAGPFDRERIRVNLITQLKGRAAEEIAKLDRVRNWEAIGRIEKTREQQLADVDRFLEQMEQAYDNNEVSANYDTASQILATDGPLEALRFLGSKSADRARKLEVLNFAKDRAEEAIRKLLREKLLAALLQEGASQFNQAEATYREVISEDGAWSEPRNLLAGLLRRRGEIIEPAEGNRKLREAVQICQDTLAVNPRTADPEAWAETQNILGNALHEQGRRAEGAESPRLLGEAFTAYRAALEVYTRMQLPQDWAMVQVNLGNLLSSQAKRAEGADRQRLLGEAIVAYREAREVRMRPMSWAAMQNSLGNVLSDQAERAEGADRQRLLGEAIVAYREAREVYTREQMPEDIAMTHLNLGLALGKQGEGLAGIEGQRLQREAVETIRAALEVYTREQMPLAWAQAQDNLAYALRKQGTGAADEAEFLRLTDEAVAAYRAALEVYTRKNSAHEWAMRQHIFGNALQEQSKRAEGAESVRRLGEAVVAYRAALEVSTREQLPKDWLDTQQDLANALRALADRSEAAEAERLRAEAEGIDRELAAAP